MMNRVEKFAQLLTVNIRSLATRACLLTILGIETTVLKYIPETRGIFPEPFDFFNHVGNFDLGTGFAAGFAMRAIAAYHRRESGQQADPPSMKARVAAGGLLAGMLINGFVETRWGVKLTGWENTGDPIDFVYGAISGATGALLAPSLNPPEPKPESLQE